MVHTLYIVIIWLFIFYISQDGVWSHYKFLYCYHQIIFKYLINLLLHKPLLHHPLVCFCQPTIFIILYYIFIDIYSKKKNLNQNKNTF